MTDRFGATYWAVVSTVTAAAAIWWFGNDFVSNSLLAAAGTAGVLGGWNRTRHLALWLSGGVAAVSGTLFTLTIEAAMNGADEDPSALPLLIAFLGAAVTSGTVHHSIAQRQARRDRELSTRLAALATAEDLLEMEKRLAILCAASDAATAQSW